MRKGVWGHTHVDAPAQAGAVVGAVPEAALVALPKDVQHHLTGLLGSNGGLGGQFGVISGEPGVVSRWDLGPPPPHLHLVGLPDDPQGFVHVGVLGTVLDQDHLHPCPFLGGTGTPQR